MTFSFIISYNFCLIVIQIFISRVEPCTSRALQIFLKILNNRYIFKILKNKSMKNYICSSQENYICPLRLRILVSSLFIPICMIVKFRVYMKVFKNYVKICVSQFFCWNFLSFSTNSIRPFLLLLLLLLFFFLRRTLPIIEQKF